MSIGRDCNELIPAGCNYCEGTGCRFCHGTGDFNADPAVQEEISE